MSKSKAILAAEKADREQAIKYLIEDYELAPGVALYTIIRNVSRDGMTRSISVFQVLDGMIFRLDHLVARVLGRKLDHNNGGVKCHGVGMDMAFELVYSLGRTLWPDDERGGYRLNHRHL
jgi:hypothetical protein